MPLQRSSKWVSGRRPTTEQGTNPKDELGMLKVPVGIISPTALMVEAICMQDGDEKYGPFNYRVTKVQAAIYLEAGLRHIYAILDGEDYDATTGKPHIGYARSTLGIYADAWINGTLIDNRPVSGSAHHIMNEFARSPGQPELSPGEIMTRFEQIREHNRILREGR